MAAVCIYNVMKSIACTIRVVVLLICSCLFYGEVPFVKLHNFQEKRKKGNDFEYIICMESWICLIYAFLYWKWYFINLGIWYNKRGLHLANFTSILYYIYFHKELLLSFDILFLCLIILEQVSNKQNITSTDVTLKIRFKAATK